VSATTGRPCSSQTRLCNRGFPWSFSSCFGGAAIVTAAATIVATSPAAITIIVTTVVGGDGADPRRQQPTIIKQSMSRYRYFFAI
jgi:hypothetical protein